MNKKQKIIAKYHVSFFKDNGNGGWGTFDKIYLREGQILEEEVSKLAERRWLVGYSITLTEQKL